MTYELPYGIKVVVAEPIYDRSQGSTRMAGTVASNLAHNLGAPDDSPAAGQQRLEGRVEALECFLLALACAGVNIGSREFVRALQDTVERLGTPPGLEESASSPGTTQQ